MTFFNRPTFDKKPRALVVAYLVLFAVSFIGTMAYGLYVSHFMNPYDEQSLAVADNLSRWMRYSTVPVTMFAVIGLATPDSAKKSLRNGAIAAAVIIIAYAILFGVI